MKPILVNLGCGSRFNPQWLNFDIHSSSPAVRACDLLRGVPLADASCDAVYNAALLEHLPRSLAERFLCECNRILKPGGILRIGVPDLEQICRLYLEKLAEASRGNQTADTEYDWILLELLDQLVRTRSGGLMLGSLKNHAVNPVFVQSRIGDEYRQLQASLASPASRLTRLRQLPPHEARHRIWQAIRQGPNKLRRAIARLILSSRDREALSEGIFRNSGEVHRWMYDRYSLPRLLVASGFREPMVRPFDQSGIANNWPEQGLDSDKHGRPLKPDLIFIECIK